MVISGNIFCFSIDDIDIIVRPGPLNKDNAKKMKKNMFTFNIFIYCTAV